MRYKSNKRRSMPFILGKFFLMLISGDKKSFLSRPPAFFRKIIKKNIFSNILPACLFEKSQKLIIYEKKIFFSPVASIIANHCGSSFNDQVCGGKYDNNAVLLPSRKKLTRFLHYFEKLTRFGYFCKVNTFWMIYAKGYGHHSQRNFFFSLYRDTSSFFVA